jgi:AmiR/NasT family two-component response regulator
MTTPARSLRILFADDDAEVRDYFQEILTRLGHQVALAQNGRQLVELSKVAEPDLIITDVMMPDLDGLQAAQAINRDRSVPIIVVSAHHDADLLSRLGTDELMAYLVKPVKEADVRTAIAVAMNRFEQLQTLRREKDDLRQALEDRKFLERAKGAVMKRLRADEQEAFRKMKKFASDTNRKLSEVAQIILEAEDVFARLDRS